MERFADGADDVAADEMEERTWDRTLVEAGEGQVQLLRLPPVDLDLDRRREQDRVVPHLQKDEDRCKNQVVGG